LEPIVGKTFTGETLHIDGAHYSGCRFTNCSLVYSGGALPTLMSNRFDNCKWLFGGAATNTLQFLRMLQLSGMAPIIAMIVRDLQAPAPAEGPKIYGRFTECQQNVHDANMTDDSDAMLSRLLFVVSGKGQEYHGSVTVKQIAGGSFEEDPLEVGSIVYPREAPQFKYDQFRAVAEECYRQQVGSRGSGIKMSNNLFRFDIPFVIDAADGPIGGTW
jgi:hypothetical protein